MSTDDAKLVHESLTQLVAVTPGSDLTAVLIESGWRELWVEDRPLAVQALFDAQGSALAGSPMLGVVLALELGGAEALAGELPTALIPVPAAGARPPARALTGGGLEVDGVLLGSVVPDELLIAATSEPEELLVCHVPAAALRQEPVEGLDAASGIVRVRGTVGTDDIDVTGRRDVGAWQDAIAVCRLAVAQEMLRATDDALALALEHAREREQFGRPIGAFQAVQHRLADATVALEVGRLALEEGWRAGDTAAAAVAKALAGRAAREVAKQAQQVLGGMGFTWEHPFHFKLRRMLVLEALLGSCVQVERELGTGLLEARALPELRAL